MNKKQFVQSYKVYTVNDGTGVLGNIFQLLLLWICVFATVLCFATGIEMPISFAEIMLWSFLFVVLFALVVFNKITMLVSLGLAGAGIAIFWQKLMSFAAFLYQAFRYAYDVAFVIMKERGYNYTQWMLTDVDTIKEVMEDTLLVASYCRSIVIVLSLVLAFWCVAVSWKRPRMWLVFIPCLAVLSPGFVIGIVPTAVAFCLLLAGAIGLYAQGLSLGKTNRRSIKEWFKDIFGKQKAGRRFLVSARGGIYGLFSFAVSFATMMLVALITYNTPLLKLDKLREQMDSAVEKVYNEIFYSRLETPENAIGSMLEGDTHEVLHIPNFHDVPVMNVKGTSNEVMYLRAWVTDDWKNDGWKVLDKEDSKEVDKILDPGFDTSNMLWTLHELLEPERLEDASPRRYGVALDDLTIKAKFKKSLIVHIPTAPQEYKVDGEYDAVEDVAGEMKFFVGARPKNNVYEVDHIQAINASKGYYTSLHAMQEKYQLLLNIDANAIQSKQFQNFVKNEKAYNEYVQKHYLNANMATDTMKELADSVSKKYSTRLTKVLSVERLLRTSYTYSIEPPSLHSDDALKELDYCLSESMTGYCTYYASAMTMMLRHLGIPARYVTGYILHRSEDIESSYNRTVMDTDAHAWVEVYFPGLGWMTFDPTPDAKETASEVEQRYLALTMIENGEGNKTEITQQVITDINEADEPEEEEEEEIDPPLFVFEGWFAVMVIVLVIVVLLVGFALLVLFLLSYAHRKTIQLWQKKRQEGSEQIFKMMLELLRLMHLEPTGGELIADYAARVDRALPIAGGWKYLEPIFTAEQFGGILPNDEQNASILTYFDALCSYALENKKTKISLLSKLKLLWHYRKEK